jgi:hypothetical protein
VIPPEGRAAALAPLVFPPIPADIPAGLRAEFEEMGKEMISEGASHELSKIRAIRRVRDGWTWTMGGEGHYVVAPR